MNSKIFIINGVGGAGKDTFIEFVRRTSLKPTRNVDTVANVKQAAHYLGWDGEKTPEARQFLSDLKKMSILFNDNPFQQSMEQVRKATLINNSYIFIHSREPAEIERFTKEIEAEYNITPLTIMVTNSNIPNKLGNSSDDGVHNYDYDITIDNSGTLDELKSKVISFVEILNN